MDTKRKTRAKEYYNLNELQKELYEKSKNGCKNFKNLYEKIISEENILSAYRILKSNKGGKTAGVDGKTIKTLADMEQDKFIKLILNRLDNYRPNTVRRVFIPKDNGDKRPLGIPTIEDRIIQQMFVNVLEPICEGKFYKESYGFRPMRSTRHAIAKVQTLININKLHYTVDIDIKGFFDNVNHSRLMKQIWNIGIKDKRILAIIGKMLKAPIKGEGIPSKGVPQGGVLSPLLSNIVLNDLDHWISNQWDTFETKHKYSGNDVKVRSLRDRTKLKEGYIVRYADDFRIMARDYKTAVKWFYAVKGYLKDRLKLDISETKSKIINLRKQSSEFLGFKIKTKINKKKFVAITYIADNKKEGIITRLRELIKVMQKNPTAENARKYNSIVLGTHQYFRYATHVSNSFVEIEHRLLKTQNNRLRLVGKYEYPKLEKTATYRKFYNITRKTYRVGGHHLFPLSNIKTQTNLNYSQSKNPYEQVKKFKWDSEIIKLMQSRAGNRSAEYMDNRLSVYSQQKGRCGVTKIELNAEVVHCHHKVPIKLGGDDKFNNLIVVHELVHKLIHATKKETINKYLKLLSINANQLRKINQLRLLCKLEKI